MQSKTIYNRTLLNEFQKFNEFVCKKWDETLRITHAIILSRIKLLRVCAKSIECIRLCTKTLLSLSDFVIRQIITRPP